jgi:hypothetical protein
MTDLFLRSDAWVAQISPLFPLWQGMLRLDDRRAVNFETNSGSKTPQR